MCKSQTLRKSRNLLYFFSLTFFLFFILPTISAVVKVSIVPTAIVPSSNSTTYWGGYLPTTLPHNILANLLWSVAGHIIDTDMDFNKHNIVNVSNVTLDKLNITGSLTVSGNFSAKRPYWNGYYNDSDNFISTARVQKMNLSNNNDYDAYLISINATQSIKFSQTGDYLCILSPEFTNTATTATVAFWMRKNGVDVPWTNSRFSISNGEYLAPAIPFQFDITSPSTDYIDFYWYSSSTNTQIISIASLTSPDRPGIPGIILNCQKISEIT